MKFFIFASLLLGYIAMIFPNTIQDNEIQELRDTIITLKSSIENAKNECKLDIENMKLYLKNNYMDEISKLKENIIINMDQKMEDTNTAKHRLIAEEHGYNSMYHSSSKERIRREISSLSNGGSIGEKIAFDAYLSHYIGDLGKYQPIKFDLVTNNIGGLYNPTTGVFNCMNDGTYVFFVRHLVYKGVQMTAELVNNGTIVSHLYTRNDETWAHASTMAIVNLKRGDPVWVQANQSISGTEIDDTVSSFAGFLLYS